LSALVGAEAIRTLTHECGLSIEVVSEYSDKLRFADCSYDLVNCRQVLHHARDLPQMCREIFRVLKPSGRMVATREHVISKRDELQTFLNTHPLHQLYGGEHAFLLAEYTAAITSAGLRIEKLLAPFDSPINDFPMSEAQWVHIYTAPIAKVLGWNLTKKLFRRTRGSGSLLLPGLAKLANWHNQTPGRLYFFVAHSPNLLDLWVYSCC
jgi:SAM-dependent methyltransferase